MTMLCPSVSDSWGVVYMKSIRSPVFMAEDKGFYIAVAGLRGWALWEASNDWNNTLTNAITNGMVSGW